MHAGNTSGSDSETSASGDHRLASAAAIVDVRGTMQRDHAVLAGRETQVVEREPRRASSRDRSSCRSWCCRRSAASRGRCPRQAGSRRHRAGGEEEVAHVVCRHPVHFFGHARSPLRKPASTCASGMSRLSRRPARPPGRVDVADDHDEVRPLARSTGSNPRPWPRRSVRHGSPSPPRGSSRARAGRGRRRRRAHLGVVVLPGVHEQPARSRQPRRRARSRSRRRHHRRDLHEVRARAGHVHDVHCARSWTRSQPEQPVHELPGVAADRRPFEERLAPSRKSSTSPRGRAA